MLVNLKRQLQRNRGVTVIELAVVVAVMAVLASLAAPGMASLIQAQRLRSASFDLTTDLLLARSEALKRGTNVVMAPTGGNWANGWTVQVGTTVLAQRGTLGSSVTTTSAPTSVTFNPSGRVDGAANLSFALANEVGGNRCIYLDLSGRPKQVKSTC